MNLANKLTVFRIILIPVFLCILLFEQNYALNRWWALSIFLLAVSTDYLDGYIAKTKNMITDFGVFLDPLADKLLVCAAFISFIELNLMPSWFVFLIIAREFIISGFRMLAASKNIVIAANYWGKVKTVFQFATVVYILSLYKGSDQCDYIYLSLIWITAILTVTSVVIYIVRNIGVIKG